MCTLLTSMHPLHVFEIILFGRTQLIAMTAAHALLIFAAWMRTSNVLRSRREQAKNAIAKITLIVLDFSGTVLQANVQLESMVVRELLRAGVAFESSVADIFYLFQKFVKNRHTSHALR